MGPLALALLAAALWPRAASPACVVAPDAASEEPNFFYYGEKTRPVSILTTGRATHRITSAIFRLLARDVLGYQNVTTVTMGDPRSAFDPDKQFPYISSCTDSRYDLSTHVLNCSTT